MLSNSISHFRVYTRSLFPVATIRLFSLVHVIEGANKEEPSVYCRKHRTNHKQEMATQNDENVFASPWNDSDMVLVVEDQELHVHKSFLTVLSPVFKAMFKDHYKEASEDKVTLEGKDLKSMVLFLQVLYPPSMFETSKALLNDEGRLSVMALAEEYQCVNLIKQCIDKAVITPKNVLNIMPFATKYYQTALPRMYHVIKRSVATGKLKELLPKIESKETSDTMLLTKCHFLESKVVEMQDALITLLRVVLNEQRLSTFTSIKTGCLCRQRIEVGEIYKIKGCLNCTENYKEKFIGSISYCKFKMDVLDMLQSGDDVTNGVKDYEMSK